MPGVWEGACLSVCTLMIRVDKKWYLPSLSVKHYQHPFYIFFFRTTLRRYLMVVQQMRIYVYINSLPSFSWQIIYFQFTRFHLEPQCRYDSLKIFDGSTTDGNPLISRCWDILPDDVDTTGNVATLQFQTDDYGTFAGFSVDYTAVFPNTMGKGKWNRTITSGHGNAFFFTGPLWDLNFQFP